MKKILLSLLLSSSCLAINIDDNIHKYDWNGVEVTWLEDSKLPTYDMTIYFADGAISDGKHEGLTNMMFDMLLAGTNRFSRQEIADNLEFYGVGINSRVVHEYSTFSVSGLSKDIIPTIKKVCHLFKTSTFPETEVKNNIKNKISDIKNLVNNPGSFANHSFRSISLAGTPFQSSISGSLKSIDKIKVQDLKSHLDYFNNKVKKKIYINGPKSVLNIQNTIKKDCGWDGEASVVREVTYKAPKREGGLHLVVVPKANQAQVRAGLFLEKGEYKDFEGLTLLSEILGGGFTSILMEEIRVKRGLTYSVNSSASGQKEYGRSVISTFTKTETIGELIKVLRDTLSDESIAKISQEKLDITKNSLKGAYAFQFEKNQSFLMELLFLDHLGENRSRIFNFNKNIDKKNLDEIKAMIKTVFPVDKMDIVVFGEKDLLKDLKKLGQVKVHNYTDFL